MRLCVGSPKLVHSLPITASMYRAGRSRAKMQLLYTGQYKADLGSRAKIKLFHTTAVSVSPETVTGLFFKENGPNFICISEMKNYDNFNETAQS